MANPTVDTYFSNDAQNQTTNTQRATSDWAHNPDYNFQPPSGASDGLLETSTNIFVYANGNIVGMISTFQVTEQRTVDKLQAIGYEGVVQAVPANTNGGTLRVDRLALYGANIWRALGLTVNGYASSEIGARIHNTGLSLTGDTYITDSALIGGTIPANEVFRTLRDQRVPLEITYKRKLDGVDNTFYEEHYVDCWLQQFGSAYNAGTITVTETVTISYGDVY